MAALVPDGFEEGVATLGGLVVVLAGRVPARISDKWVALILAALAGDPRQADTRSMATPSSPTASRESARRC